MNKFYTYITTYLTIRKYIFLRESLIFIKMDSIIV